MVTVYDALREVSDLMDACEPEVAKPQLDNVLLCLAKKYPLTYSYNKALIEIEFEEAPLTCQQCDGSGEGRAAGTTCSKCKGSGQDQDLMTHLLNKVT